MLTLSVRRRALLAAFAVLSLSAAAPAGEPRVDFARDIRPLLAGKCYDCHGREDAKGGLSFVARGAVLRGGKSGLPTLVPGAAEKSEIYQRVISPHDDEVMPQKGDRLKPAEIALLKRWIDEGAVWPENVRHWAYVAPVRPAIPAVENRKSAIENPIDAFVVARLAPEKLAPSPAADRPRWLRADHARELCRDLTARGLLTVE